MTRGSSAWGFFACALVASAAFLCVLMLLPAPEAQAASLTQVRDLISTSAPSASSTHIVDFTVTNTIPASGKIVLTPQAGSVNILSVFNYTDVDVSVSSGGPYVHRVLAATASATEDGVAVVSGTSGSVTITLNSTSPIAAGERVRVVLGTGASEGVAGDVDLRHTATVGSYKMTITTRNASNAAIDTASAMFAIVRPVATTLYTQNFPPILSNGLPSGLLAPGNVSIELSLNTNEPASCRYSTIPNTAYAAMTKSFNNISGVLHYVAVAGHVDDTTYTYYVRCADAIQMENLSDYVITFTLDETPISDSSVEIFGVTGRGGEGRIPDGSERLYRANVTLSGFGPSGSSVYVLKDGVQQASVVSTTEGRFSAQVQDLERGTYTFVTYALDSKGRRTASVPSTMALQQGTNNTILNIVLPPSMELAKNQVGLTDDITVFGESVPGSVVEIYVAKTGTIRDAKKFTATTTRGVQGFPDGSYSVTFNARQFPQGTYDIRSKAVLAALSSNLSAPIAVGIGEVPQPRTGLRSDLNKDGKVNLTDFSILLTFWLKTSPDLADINEDGIVNLADFSIMLFDWTG